MASFFLWNIGSVEQSSQDGLARGLLYHVLEQNPTLISAVLPHMWQEAQNGTSDLRVLSDIETKIAFQNLGAVSTNGAFAFFIDGLDEFTGNERDGISFVKSLATSANIKLLVSSRPVDTCIAAFSSAPQLRLQDLTRPDIEVYINDIVRSHPYIAEYKFVSRQIVQELIEDIQNKASGVFLWVVLACRTLIEGFEAYDDGEELRHRVDDLPPELESLFRHILNSLPPRFLQQAAKLLQVCYTSHLLQIEPDISALALAWAHEKDMKISSLGDFTPVSLDDQVAKCSMLEGRLRSRCRGFLEIYPRVDREFPIVDFMHRTVFEFLSIRDVWKLDCLQIHDPEFDVGTVLAYMTCYRLYLSPETSDRDEGLVRATFRYIQEVAQGLPLNLTQLLNSFAFATMRPENDEQVSPAPMQDIVLLLAVELELTTFLQDHDLRSFNTRQKLKIQAASLGYNLLYHVFRKPLMLNDSAVQEGYPCSSTIVDLLIRSGCDPNESITLSGNDKRTCWTIWMQSHHKVDPDSSQIEPAEPSGYLDFAETTMIMIRAGADIAGYGVYLKRLADRWVRKVEKSSRVKDQERMTELWNEMEQAVVADQQEDWSVPVYNSDSD